MYTTAVSPSISSGVWTEARRFVAADILARMQKHVGHEVLLPLARHRWGEEVARADRLCAREQRAPGQHGGGLAEAAAVQQCSRDSGRGQWRSTHDLTRLKIDQIDRSKTSKD